MAITKANRLAVLSQIKNKTKDPAVIAQFESYLDDNSPLGDTLQQMFFAQSEATKLVQQVRAEEQKLAEERTKLVTDYNNLQTWRATVESELTSAKQQANNVAIAANKKIAELKSKAEADSLDLKDFNVTFDLAAIPTPTNPTNNSTNNPQKKEASPMSNNQPQPNQEEAGRALIKGLTGLVSLTQSHRNLFGQDLDVDGLVDRALAENRGYLEVYEELYNPQAKREEIANKSIEDRINQKAQELFEQKLSTLIDPSGKSQSIGDFSRIMAPESPVFKGLGATAKDDPQYRNDPRFMTTIPPVPQPTNNPNDPNNPNPNPTNPIVPQQSPIVRQQEELEWAKEFGTNLMNKAS